MRQFSEYINDCLAELHQVRWPTRQQALRLTTIVIGFTAVASVFFGALDFGLNQVVTFLISLA